MSIHPLEFNALLSGAMSGAVPIDLDQAARYLADGMSGWIDLYGAQKVATWAQFLALSPTQRQEMAGANDEAIRKALAATKNNEVVSGIGFYPLWKKRDTPEEAAKTCPTLFDKGGLHFHGYQTSSTVFWQNNDINRDRTVFVVVSRGDGDGMQWDLTRRENRRDETDPAEPLRSTVFGAYQRSITFSDFDVILTEGGWNHVLHYQAADLKHRRITLHQTAINHCTEIGVYVDGTHMDAAPALVRPDGRPLPSRAANGADRFDCDGLFNYGVGALGLVDVGGVQLRPGYVRYGSAYQQRVETAAHGLNAAGDTLTFGDLTLTWRAEQTGELLDITIPEAAADVGITVVNKLRDLIDAKILEEDYPLAWKGAYYVATNGTVLIVCRQPNNTAEADFVATYTVASSNPAAFEFLSAAPVTGADTATFLGLPDRRGSTGISVSRWKHMVLTDWGEEGKFRTFDIDEGRNPLAPGQAFAIRFDGFVGNSVGCIRGHYMEETCYISSFRPARVLFNKVDLLTVRGWIQQNSSGAMDSEGNPLAGEDAYYGPGAGPLNFSNSLRWECSDDPDERYFPMNGRRVTIDQPDRTRKASLYATDALSFGTEKTNATRNLFRIFAGRVSGAGGFDVRSSSNTKLARLEYRVGDRRWNFEFQKEAGATAVTGFAIGKSGVSDAVLLTSTGEFADGILVNAALGKFVAQAPDGFELRRITTPRLWCTDAGAVNFTGGLAGDTLTLATSLAISGNTLAVAGSGANATMHLGSAGTMQFGNEVGAQVSPGRSMYATTASIAALMLAWESSTTNRQRIVRARARASMGAVQSGDMIGSDFWVASDGGKYLAVAEMRVTATANATTDNVAGKWEVLLNPGGVSVSAVLGASNATGLELFGSVIVDANRHLAPRSYTVATKPSAATAGRIIWISDLGGGGGTCESDGTLWRRLRATGTQVASGDGNFTWTYLGSGRTLRHTGTLSTPRTMTLSATDIPDGERLRVIRTGGSSGGTHGLSVGGLTTLATNEWCDVEYSNGAFILLQKAALP